MKNSVVTILAVVAAIATGAVVGALPNNIKIDQVIEIEQNHTVKTAAKPKYRLAEYKGKIGVYITGKLTPELVFDIYLHHLPDVDRYKLEEGIDVENYDQLLALIEDYTS